MLIREAGIGSCGTMSGWRIIGWGTGAILLALPAMAMQLTSGVNWTALDFLVGGTLIGSVGLAVELVVRRSTKGAYRAGAAAALVAAFLTIWSNLAVGMIGSEDNLYNLIFIALAVVAGILVGIARFRAAAMVRLMLGTAAVQFLASVGGMAQDHRGGLFSMAFTMLWLGSALLYGRAAFRES